MHVTGQIGYSLAIQVSRGTMLGPDQPVILHLLDIPPASQSLDGVKMELIDAALPLVHGALALADQLSLLQGRRQLCVQAFSCSCKACGCDWFYARSPHAICLLNGDGSATAVWLSSWYFAVPQTHFAIRGAFAQAYWLPPT